MGIVCTGLLVIDCDTGEGADGTRELAAFFHAYGDVLPSATVETGGGGRHFYFLVPDGVKTLSNSAGKLGPGIDTRGDGGQVVASPSVHESGRRYRWLTDGEGPPSRDSLPVAPVWPLELLAKQPAGDTAEEPPEAAPVPPDVPDVGAAKAGRNPLGRRPRGQGGDPQRPLESGGVLFRGLDGAGRIDAGVVTAALWEACAGYRAADGDRQTRLTIDSDWDSGQKSPLQGREVSGAFPRGGGSGNRSAAKVSEGLALGVYRLKGSGGLGLEPLGDACRLLDSHSGKLMVAWSGGGSTAREASLHAGAVGSGRGTGPNSGPGTASEPAGGRPRSRRRPANGTGSRTRQRKL